MKKSRVELKPAKGGLVEVFIICEDTKQVTPVYGLDRIGAYMLAQLLVDLHKGGLSLPEEIIDQTWEKSDD